MTASLLNLGEVLATSARLLPDRIGARDLERAMTFPEWNARACRLANALLGLGLEKGDRVAVLACNRVEWMEIYAAVANAGLVVVPINFRLVGQEIAYIVNDCGARAFVVEGALLDRAKEVRAALSVEAGRYVHLGGEQTPMAAVVMTTLVRLRRGRISATGAVVSVRPASRHVPLLQSTFGRKIGASVNVGSRANRTGLTTATRQGALCSADAAIVCPNRRHQRATSSRRRSTGTRPLRPNPGHGLVSVEADGRLAPAGQMLQSYMDD